MLLKQIKTFHCDKKKFFNNKLKISETLQSAIYYVLGSNQVF